jgi:hypothetical protein
VSARRLIGGGLLVAALALAGCTPAVPEPAPAPTPGSPAAVLSVDQADAVIQALDEVLVAGDEAKDAAALAPRVEDPALAMRAAQYTLDQRSNGERTPSPLTTAHDVRVIAATDTWPRTLIAVTDPPEGTTSPLVLTLKQNDPRSQYKLWAWARLFPGIETPPLAQPEVGSPQLPPDASGLVLTPEETVAAYADVLAQGGDSEYAATFGSDPFVDQLRSSASTVSSNLQGLADVSFQASPIEGAVVAMGTADGGAIVVGTITNSLTIKKTLTGSTLELGGEIKQWLGDGTIPSIAKVTYTSPVVFEVPAAADGATITVMGAEQVLVDATKQ